MRVAELFGSCIRHIQHNVGVLAMWSAILHCNNTRLTVLSILHEKNSTERQGFVCHNSGVVHVELFTVRHKSPMKLLPIPRCFFYHSVAYRVTYSVSRTNTGEKSNERENFFTCKELQWFDTSYYEGFWRHHTNVRTVERPFSRRANSTFLTKHPKMAHILATRGHLRERVKKSEYNSSSKQFYSIGQSYGEMGYGSQPPFL